MKKTNSYVKLIVYWVYIYKYMCVYKSTFISKGDQVISSGRNKALIHTFNHIYQFFTQKKSMHLSSNLHL